MEYIKFFSEITLDDIALVGGKNASLGEMYRRLADAGVNVPNGFATTSDAFRYYLEHNQLTEKITAALNQLDVHDVNALIKTGARIRHWMRHGKLPNDLAEEILQAYATLEQQYGEDVDVAVRSSATAEDLPSASFAGQQETYLNIRGDRNLISTCKQVFASLFTDRAISYREENNFHHMDVALSLSIQKMVRADSACSGVMFTLDTETGFKDVIFITSAYGLGENIVQGTVNPDEFYVHKPTLAKGFQPIIKRQLGSKAIKMICTKDPLPGASTQNVPVRQTDQFAFSLRDDEILQLARYAMTIEAHYSQHAGKPRPMDIEWAKDGTTGELFIVQARPETVQASKDPRFQDAYKLKAKSRVITIGKSVGKKIACGPVRVIFEAAHMNELQPGEILVTDITDPDWEPIMKRAAAIVTNRGGRTCHAAIVARELGIPAVVGCSNATQTLIDGQVVTVSCAEGDTGYVYDSDLPFSREQINLSSSKRPITKIMLNVGNPEQAFEVSQLPNDGVGLARLEFIINNTIGIHPQALLNFSTLDAKLQAAIRPKMAGYSSPVDFYINRLSEGVATIAAAFYPKPVIVRFSDFKSNEYASLIGGHDYEPQEENPMIGFRGASRYQSDLFADCFALECAAIKKVRENMGLTNVHVMIPFVRTVATATHVLAQLEQHGLPRTEQGLHVYLIVKCQVTPYWLNSF